MAQQLLYKFDIDGTDILSYVLEGTKIYCSRNNDSGNSSRIIVSSNVDNIISLSVGQTVIISRGVSSNTEDYRFRGSIKKIEVDSEDNYVLVCADKLNQLKYNIFSYSYDKNIDSEAGELSAIFEDIVEKGGFTSSVVSSGTGSSDVTAEKFISRKNDRLDRLSVIAKILNWIFYYDYNNDWVRLEPKGYETYSNSLIVGTNVYNVLKWKEDLESVRNKITVEGAYILDTRKETETGDNSTTEFSFTYTPVTTDLTVDGTLQVRGAPDSLSDYDYVVDVENKTYTFETAPTSGQSIIMNYTTKIPIPVIGTSPSSISKYGLTQEANYDFDDIVNVTDAETRLQQLLDILEDAPVSVTMQTDEYTIRPGMKVSVEDSQHSAHSGEYIVYETIINYPDPLDTVTVGSLRFNIQNLFKTISERLRILENKDSNLSDILRSLINLLHLDDYSRYSMQTEKKPMSGGIYGHPSLGVYGSSVYGDNTSFVLGDANYAVLGTSSLGDVGSAWSEQYEEIYWS